MEAPAGSSSASGSGPMARPAPLGSRSVIANPRIENAVDDVGDQVEHHDHDSSDHQPCHHRIWIGCLKGVDEVGTHAVEGEDLLGHDCTAEDAAEIERHDRDQWD